MPSQQKCIEASCSSLNRLAKFLRSLQCFAELFVLDDYPHAAKFARLTAQEERCGLIDGDGPIGNREHWNARLEECGAAPRGHRLVRIT